MPSADRLEEFVVIIESGSILAAAHRLGIPRATLSRHLRDLEDELGTQLVHRSTRRLLLTVAGEHLYAHARRAVDEIAASWAAMKDSDGPLQGRLRIAIPPEFVFGPLIKSFYEAHPRLEVEVLTWTPLLDLLGSRVDVALIIGSPDNPALTARPLWTVDMRLVGTRRYLERCPAVTDLESLTEVECILEIGHDGRAIRRLPLLGGGEVAVSGRLALPDIMMRLKAVELGNGLSFLPIVGGQEHWEERVDEFELVLPDEVGSSVTCSIVHPKSQHVSRGVRAFLEHATRFYDRATIERRPHTRRAVA